MDQDQAQALPEMWAIVELFGHQKVAGKVTTLNLGPACLIRVTIPEVTRQTVRWQDANIGAKRVCADVTTPEHDRLFGVGAIYSINPCTEKTVRELLRTMESAPISSYDIDGVKMLPAREKESADDADSADQSL